MIRFYMKLMFSEFKLLPLWPVERVVIQFDVLSVHDFYSKRD
jgi:hypothetical protein